MKRKITDLKPNTSNSKSTSSLNTTDAKNSSNSNNNTATNNISAGNPNDYNSTDTTFSGNVVNQVALLTGQQIFEKFSQLTQYNLDYTNNQMVYNLPPFLAYSSSSNLLTPTSASNITAMNNSGINSLNEQLSNMSSSAKSIVDKRKSELIRNASYAASKSQSPSPSKPTSPLSRSFPASMLAPSLAAIKSDQAEHKQTVFTFPQQLATITPLNSPLSPHWSNRGESTIPLKKRMFAESMGPPSHKSLSDLIGSQESMVSSFSPSTSSFQLTLSENSKLNLSAWHKCRVLALYRRTSRQDRKQLSAGVVSSCKLSLSDPLYSKSDHDQVDELFYYPATIESTNGSLVIVSFDASIDQICKQDYSTSLSSSYNLMTQYQQTYDIAKEEEKYSLIDDAQPQAEQLEKGLYVLYRSHTTNATSYPSTPTLATQQTSLNYKANTTATNTAACCMMTRYRLGKIVEIKNESSEIKSKLFSIQPIMIDAKNNLITQDLGLNNSIQLVTRPNIRFISPPWFFEYKSELNLKTSQELQLTTIFSTKKFSMNFNNNEEEESKSFN